MTGSTKLRVAALASAASLALSASPASALSAAFSGLFTKDNDLGAVMFTVGAGGGFVQVRNWANGGGSFDVDDGFGGTSTVIADPVADDPALYGFDSVLTIFRSPNNAVLDAADAVAETNDVGAEIYFTNEVTEIRPGPRGPRVVTVPTDPEPTPLNKARYPDAWEAVTPDGPQYDAQISKRLSEGTYFAVVSSVYNDPKGATWENGFEYRNTMALTNPGAAGNDESFSRVVNWLDPKCPVGSYFCDPYEVFGEGLNRSGNFLLELAGVETASAYNVAGLVSTTRVGLGGLSLTTGDSLAFQSSLNGASAPIPTPIPGALPLLAGGLAAAGLVLRRRA